MDHTFHGDQEIHEKGERIYDEDESDADIFILVYLV